AGVVWVSGRAEGSCPACVGVRRYCVVRAPAGSTLFPYTTLFRSGEGRDGDCAERDADGGGHSGGASADESDAGECGGGDGGGDGACEGQRIYAGIGGAGQWDGAPDDVCVGERSEHSVQCGGGEQCGEDV